MHYLLPHLQVPGELHEGIEGEELVGVLQHPREHQPGGHDYNGDGDDNLDENGFIDEKGDEDDDDDGEEEDGDWGL